MRVPVTRVIGAALLLHGLAHAAVGMWASPVAHVWLVTSLWLVAMCGFVAAGVGLLGVAPLERIWRPLSTVAAVASVGLIAVARHPVLVIGAALDGGILATNLALALSDFRAWWDAPIHPVHRRAARLLAAFGVVFVAYLSALVLVRPWHMRWGTSNAELEMTLPGDELVPNAGYRIDHAVTIHAPADSVWPWLAQIGQDRGGFYSYDWLERLFADPVRNAERIVPEWQTLQVGDLIQATPPDYLGGVFGRALGWRVVAIERGRALVLEGWGAFVLEPIDDSTTRFLVRTRGDGLPSYKGIVLAPLGLLVFEPAHFIMQRGMLLGIRERAERRL